MNFFFLLGILAVAVAVLLPFLYLGLKKSSVQPGMAHEILKPGYRRYTISVPQGYTGEESVPLILALHFSGHGIPYYGELILSNLVEPAMRELGAVIVAPDCPVRSWTQPESERLILDLLDDLQERFNIDPQRILVTGFSLGGRGTWYFAGHYPERFTAAIVMAGYPPEDVLELDWKIPLMVIHARNDEVNPLAETNEAVSKLEEKGVDITLRILEGVSHYETQYFVSALRNAIPWLLDAWV